MSERSAQSQPPGRYTVEIVSGEMRQKSHQQSVQRALDEGSAHGWRLVSATTTNASGSWVTGVYWDTAPER
ncbi:MAG: hypothetical protein AVDCRST_MAG02-3446 [uncultured Rubrobacteraceae bacterium]|uniref:DUF4177 domain-containing protein n=1 Tax=uncultured Rubrobacteraceae bacterium TaxID=349277 RepID=A0A6J4RAH4_9ACTN|nr:MAG: hypothetical protein AVDCRST_MAG02-3446 [uncultured Rubrobacteraceae bacterium]